MIGAPVFTYGFGSMFRRNPSCGFVTITIMALHLETFLDYF